MKGLVLSGGTGTRLRPLTHTSAKQLIPIANKPVLFYSLEDIAEVGIKEVGIIVGHTKDDVITAVGDGSKWGLKVTYIEQDAPLGLAHAVKTARNFLKDDPFVMYLGDNIMKSGIKSLYSEFVSKKPDALIALCKVKHPERFGVAAMKGDNVVKLVEKPKQFVSDFALVGVYFFTTSIFDAIEKIKPSWRNELEITDAIQQLIESNLVVTAKIIEGWWKDTGKPEDILEVNNFILSELPRKIAESAKIEEDVKIIGNMQIGENTIIKNGTVMRGPIVIGNGCEIGPNCYVGPYTSIGDNCKIEGGEIESSIVISDTIICCGQRLIDCLIGKNSKILSKGESLPKSAYKLIIGENSTVSI